MINGITPVCRYGHGELAKIKSEVSNDAWGYINAMDPNLVFSGELYTCMQCGYTELFDNDLDSSKR